MSLARKAIRHAIARALMNRTAAKDRVYCNREDPAWDVDEPAILIRSRSEQVEVLQNAPRSYKRTLTLEIACIAGEKLKGKADDLADDLAAQVENLLFYRPGLNDLPGLAKLTLDPARSALRSGDIEVQIGERVFTGWTIVLDVAYVTEHLHPSERTLSPLEAFDIDWDFPPPSDNDELEAEDEVELPVS